MKAHPWKVAAKKAGEEEHGNKTYERKIKIQPVFFIGNKYQKEENGHA